QHGMGKNMHGRGAEDLVLRVPVGTVVRDAESGAVLGDLVEHGQRLVVARGGRGGRGNARFVTLQNKAPSFAEKGEPGEERWLELELKLLADVGLVGFPNVGKSTIISRVSAARPKIANYHFTTVVPNLGVVRVDEGDSFVIADIPGLIEGAHSGAGLGHQFLRHVERTRVLVHVLDIAGTEGRDPLEDFAVINRELALYDQRLALRPMLVAANKTDLPGAEENLSRLKAALGDQYEIFPLSAISGEGLLPLIHRLAEMLRELPAIPPEQPAAQPEGQYVAGALEPRFTLRKQDGVFWIGGREIERHVAMTQLENEAALERLYSIMKLMGIDQALQEAGIKDGDTVVIGNYSFEYVAD
ncbi:MAG: GTPase ObgE, partial [Bacillota bacterium]